MTLDANKALVRRAIGYNHGAADDGTENFRADFLPSMPGPPPWDRPPFERFGVASPTDGPLCPPDHHHEHDGGGRRRPPPPGGGGARPAPRASLEPSRPRVDQPVRGAWNSGPNWTCWACFSRSALSRHRFPGAQRLTMAGGQACEAVPCRPRCGPRWCNAGPACLA